eukprot:scaffold41478_cov67-Phaeocystis_antarctica.AAC.1
MEDLVGYSCGVCKVRECVCQSVGLQKKRVCVSARGGGTHTDAGRPGVDPGSGLTRPSRTTFIVSPRGFPTPPGGAPDPGLPFRDAGGLGRWLGFMEKVRVGSGGAGACGALSYATEILRTRSTAYLHHGSDNVKPYRTMFPTFAVRRNT